MPKFKDGDLVLCTLGNVADADANPRLQKGIVYTVKNSFKDSNGTECVNLLEIKRTKKDPGNGIIFGYDVIRFRTRSNCNYYAVVSCRKGFHDSIDVFSCTESEKSAKELADRLNRISNDRFYSVTSVSSAEEIMAFDLKG